MRLSGRDTWPQCLADLRKEFDAGRTPKGYRPDGLRVVKDDENQDVCRVCRM